MRSIRAAFAALLLSLAVASPAYAIFIDFMGGGIVYDASTDLGWQPWTHVWTASGDTALGEEPADVTSTCNRTWLQSTVGSPTWDGTKWSVDVAVRGAGNGVVKSGGCGIFIDFTGGGVVDVDFE